MSAINCPKCSSANIYQERDRSFEPDPWILVCHTCGHRIYGEAQITTLIERQAPHLVQAFTAHIAARKADLKERFKAPPTRPTAQALTQKRGRLLVHCGLCGRGIWRRPYDVRTSSNKRFFCSLEHLSEFKRRETQQANNHNHSAVTPGSSRRKRRSSGRRGAVKVHCAVCEKPVWRRPWDVRTCKSGLFFCSTEHRLQWLRSGKPLVSKENMPEQLLKQAASIPHAT